MSSINSTQSGFGLTQFLQNLTAGASTAATNGSTGSTTATVSGLLQQLSHHGHHKGGGGFGKLADAVTNALQSAANASSGSVATDANTAITQALTKIFENGSLGATPSSGTTTPPSNNAVPTTATTTSTTSTDAGLPADFVQTLKSYGVTSQQFLSDLSTALKTAEQNGTVNVGDAFKSFPIGSVVDSVG